MARPRKKFIFTRTAVLGHFRFGDESGCGLRLKLCGLEDYQYKATQRGRVKRSVTEKARYLDVLYQDKLDYLLHQKA